MASVAALACAFAIWTHHLSSHDRNGGSAVYGIAFVLWSLSVAAGITVVTFSATLARRVSFTSQTLRFYGVIAITLTVVMAMMGARVAMWWASESVHAGAFMSGNIGDALLGRSNSFPLALDAAASLMLAGLAASFARSVPIVRMLRSVS